MKKYLLLSILGIFFFTAHGQEGTRFEDIAYNKALAKAKKENRLVFIDCYTQWCGPCKRMASNVFPLKEVGDYMNGHFVNLKVDMEKGEGVALRKQFRVESFPTFLIIHPDGTLYHKFNGAVGPKTFIAKLEEALQSDRTFGVLEKSYRKGNREKEFLSEYVLALRSCSDPTVYAVAGELFAQLNDEERFSEEYRYFFEVVNYFPVGSEAWRFFVTNREKFTELMGDEKVNRLLSVNYQHVLLGILDGKNNNLPVRELKRMERELKKLNLSQVLHTRYRVYIQIAKALHSDDIHKFLTVCEREFVKIPYKNVPKKLYTLYGDRMTDAYKARWDDLMKELEARK